ncbi:hypothetical protein D9M68_834960 [compost metagenome]
MLWRLVSQYLPLPSSKLQGCALTVLEQSQKLAGTQPLSDCLSGVADLLIGHPEPKTNFDRGYSWLLHKEIPLGSEARPVALSLVSATQGHGLAVTNRNA